MQISDEQTPTRDFTVAVFVVWNQSVLLHFHQKLNRWLPPGGHIETNELPDEAAIREVLEETGIVAHLVGEQLNTVDLQDQPRQLCRPVGVQLAVLNPSINTLTWSTWRSLKAERRRAKRPGLAEIPGNH